MAALEPKETTLIEVYEAPCPHGCLTLVRVTIIWDASAEDAHIREIVVNH